MSIIISLFIFTYLAAIVLASVLGIVWIVPLFVSLMRKVFAERLHMPQAVGWSRLLGH